jgi:hypothetical protein
MGLSVANGHDYLVFAVCPEHWGRLLRRIDMSTRQITWATERGSSELFLRPRVRSADTVAMLS